MATAHHGAPGMDGVTLEALEASGVPPGLEPRRAARVARTSQPMRVRRTAIPQDGGTHVRVLGMPTRRDRGVPGALPGLREPLVAAEGPPGFSGARPPRTAPAAVERVAEAMGSWKTRSMAGDLHASWDNVRQDGRGAKVAQRVNDADGMPRSTGLLQASGSKGVPHGGVRSPRRSTRSLTEVARRLERAQEGTRSGTDTSSEEARCADALGRRVEAPRRHDWLRHAVEHRLRDAWAVLPGPINEAQSRRVDRARGATCSVLGGAVRRGKRRRGVWRPWDTPRRKKRTALGHTLQERVRRDASQPVERVSALLHPILRGWGRSGAVGEAHRGCGGLKDGVDKQGRRPLRRARHRQGGGGKRGRKRGRSDTLQLWHTSRVSRPQPTGLPAREAP
jgi:RNA-directed DNA polymerase